MCKALGLVPRAAKTNKQQRKAIIKPQLSGQHCLSLLHFLAQDDDRTSQTHAPFPHTASGICKHLTRVWTASSVDPSARAVRSADLELHGQTLSLVIWIAHTQVHNPRKSLVKSSLSNGARRGN